MYALPPAHPAIDFGDLMVIFGMAILIGIVNYVPGSLGVVEAAMFVGLPQFRRGDLLTSFVTFRASYFVVPLLLPVLLLGLREVRSVAAGMSTHYYQRPKISRLGC